MTVNHLFVISMLIKALFLYCLCDIHLYFFFNHVVERMVKFFLDFQVVNFHGQTIFHKFN